MSLTFDNVIVFGPTGEIGGLAALEASKRGAKVWLAMRDTTKNIAQIPADIAAAGSFARVSGDLTDPASVTKAIQTSGAKAAFIYLITASPDFCASSVYALRAAGVEHVVFLSSSSVRQEGAAALRTIPEENWTPYAHAQVEIALEEAGFPTSVALRPAWFASNFFKVFLDRSVTPPKGIMLYEDIITDNITPEDIGAVGGALLVNPPVGAGRQSVFLFGPDTRQLKDSWELVKTITGRTDLDTSIMTPEALIASMAKKGVPESLAKSVANWMKQARGAGPDEIHLANLHNVKKYTGREPLGFVEYLEKHKNDIY